MNPKKKLLTPRGKLQESAVLMATEVLAVTEQVSIMQCQ